ncbi:21096_t:CDS:10, partial [Racocetra persica]
ELVQKQQVFVIGMGSYEWLFTDITNYLVGYAVVRGLGAHDRLVKSNDLDGHNAPIGWLRQLCAAMVFPNSSGYSSAKDLVTKILNSGGFGSITTSNEGNNLDGCNALIGWLRQLCAAKAFPNSGEYGSGNENLKLSVCHWNNDLDGCNAPIAKVFPNSSGYGSAKDLVTKILNSGGFGSITTSNE